MASDRKMPDGGMWNQASWKQVRKRAIAVAGDNPHCAVCGIELDMNPEHKYASNHVEVDHIIPLARGGAPYDIDNLRLTCLRCNRKKGKKMDGDYADADDPTPIPLSNAW